MFPIKPVFVTMTHATHSDDDNPFVALGEDDDPEENASEVTELQQLMSGLGNGENSCSAS